MRENANMQPGDIVEFFEQKRILIGMCLSVKMSKLNIITDTSRTMNLPMSRVLHHTPKGIPNDTPRGDIIHKLREIGKLRQEVADSINLGELWTLLDAPGTRLPLKDFAELVFPLPISANQEAGLVRAISMERIHFDYENECVIILGQEAVESALHRLDVAEAREREKNRLVEWVELTLAGQTPSEPPGLHAFLDGLKLMAADLPDQPDKVKIRDILKRITNFSTDDAFELLVKLKIFHIDENLEFIRNGFPTSFSPNTLADLKHASCITLSTSRKDLRHIQTFTIDGALTRDMDDALSVEFQEDGTVRIGIHITDVAVFVPHGSSLDLEARERAQTLYLPEKTYHMFPEELAEQLASLRVGEDRFAISTLVDFNAENEMLSYRITPSVIHVHQRMTYDDVDERISEPVFQYLYGAALKLRQLRVISGAIIMPRPELELRVNEQNQIIIKRRDRETTSQVIVSEFMILANRLAAETADMEHIPFPFRWQEAPEDPVPICSDHFDPYIAYCQRRMMTRALKSSEPKPHFSLGLTHYTTLTSPLRRYFDLIAQRQIKSVFKLEEAYTREELEDILVEIDANFARSSHIISQRNRYWILKYMMTRQGQTMDAMVLDRFPHRYQIWLHEYCMDADIPITFGKQLHPEQMIRVIVEKVKPRENLLKLRLVE